jgi:precorrin-6B methylase 2
MRLFRQKRQGDWSSAIDELSRTLATVPRDGSRLVVPSGTSTFIVCDQAEVPPDETCVEGICRAAATRYGTLQFRRDGSAASRSIEWYGEYRQRQLAFVRSLIEPGMIVVDVASGAGFDSSVLATAVGEAGHLFLLESRPAHAPLLANNLSANHVSNATVIHQTWSDESISEPLSGVDALCLPRFHVLRINEDANAVQILGGAHNCLWNFRPAIMIAATAEDVTQAAEACVRDFGYHTLRIDFPLFDAENFNRRSEDLFDGRLARALFALPEELDLRSAQSQWQRIASRAHPDRPDGKGP